MQWIELNNVEYGECIVLGGKTSVLMADCGSMNQKLRDGDVSVEERFRSIAGRYDSYMDRYFLLTHYHRDHLCGFKKILDSHPGYFNRVFLPVMPVDASGHPVLLDFALFAHLFLPVQTDCSQVNTACVRVFKLLSETRGADRIFMIGQGDSFPFDAVDYDVLWPKKRDYPFAPELISAVEEMNILFSSPFRTGIEKQFMNAKGRFLNLYVKCCGAFSVSGRAMPGMRRELLDHLLAVLRTLEDMRDELNRSPIAHDIRGLLDQPLTKSAYATCTNAASVVFHNRRTKAAGFEDILMTGDCTPETINEISGMLYDGYYVVKAPHHGTASGYAPLFSEMAISHLLISNGDYHAGGAIAQEYIDMRDTIKHCTNNTACKWFSASGCCCNRLCACFDQPSGEGLVLRCPAAAAKSQTRGCLITTVGPNGESACLCDSPAF